MNKLELFRWTNANDSLLSVELILDYFFGDESPYREQDELIGRLDDRLVHKYGDLPSGNHYFLKHGISQRCQLKGLVWYQESVSQFNDNTEPHWPIHCLKMNGELYLFDGYHRATDYLFMGELYIKARVIDLD